MLAWIGPQSTHECQLTGALLQLAFLVPEIGLILVAAAIHLFIDTYKLITL
jgi:hypothetical protein